MALHSYSARIVLIASVASLLRVGSVSAGPTVIPKIGANTTSVQDWLGQGAAESKMGYELGFDFRLGGKTLFLQPGIAWKHYGFTFETIEPNDSGEAFFNAWQFPVMVGTTGVIGENIGMVVMVGMVLDLIASTGGRTPLDEDFLTTGTWATKLALGFEFQRYSITASYDIGATPFFKRVYELNTKVNSAALMFGVAY